MCAEEQEILDDEPPMDRRMLLVVRAWFQLESCRPCIFYTEPTRLGFAIHTRRGAIPWTVVREWGAARALSDESIELLAAVIHYLDVERAEQER